VHLYSIRSRRTMSLWRRLCSGSTGRTSSGSGPNVSYGRGSRSLRSPTAGHIKRAMAV